MAKNRYTINHLRKEFGTEKQCLEYLFNLKYKDLQHCPKCGKYAKFYLIEKNRRFDSSCGHSIFPTKNTIYYKSSTLLTLWFHAMFLFSVSKKRSVFKRNQKTTRSYI